MGVAYQPNRWTIVIAIVLIAISAGAHLLQDDEVPADPATAAAAQAAAASAPAPAARRAGPSASAPRAEGGLADPARIFALGLSGDLVLDMDTQAALEMTVSELGADPSGAELQKLDEALRKGLPPAAANEAAALVKHYVAYSRDYARAIEGNPPADTPADVRAMLDRTEALQRQHFGPATAKSLFGVQMAQSRHQLDVQVVLDDKGLSTAQKTARIRTLWDQLPEDVRDLAPPTVATEEPAASQPG